VMAARSDPVLEFGLRRAQGIDGGLSASRAAYVAGCAATSNVLAGRLFGIPVRGTHAHSWVMCFDDELEAFETYARAMPNNCVFLVDTYDTLQGVRHAAQVGRRLRERGHEMVGVRLDSGDLAQLSIEARRILDAAGFPRAAIVASNDLDEHMIESLKARGATIGVWGVGTRLVTGYDQPALGGVYKLTAVHSDDGVWDDRLKVSEQAVKMSTPGVLQVRRFREAGRAIGDVILDRDRPIEGECTMVELCGGARATFAAGTDSVDLLVPVFRKGKRVYDPPPIDAVRSRVQEQLAGFDPRFKRLKQPDVYPVGLELGLHERKNDLILEERGLER
jgi:nicotinate phosphoribosyltransferase